MGKPMPHLAVNAGPGTGKTYTATSIPRYLRATKKETFLKNNQHTDEQVAIWEWVAEQILPTLPTNRPPTFMYAAYNNDMIPEVTPMVPAVKTPYGVEVRTTHGHGYKVLNRRYGYLKINSNRGTHIVEKLTGKNFYQMKDRFKWLSTLRYIEKLKDELLDATPENMEKMRAKYDGLANMPIHDDSVEQANKIIKEMKNIDRALGIEYIDQVWMALFACKSPIYDIGIIDECQDLSPARLLLVRRLCSNLIFVGDPDQAINAFAGADPHSFDKIRDVCDAELPLKISFRNPPNIIQKANALMAERATPDTSKRVLLRGIKTEKGEEKRLTLNTLAANLPEKLASALIICRYNAPLIACALKLYKAKVPCSILGKSLVTNLVSIVKQRKATSIDHLEQKLTEYEDFSCKGTQPHIQEVIRDKLDCIRLVLPQCDTVDDVESVLKEMFSVRKNEDHVSLCTIHKSKGKERPYIYILYPPIESTYATTPDQKQQEQNLHFVGITRTMKNLYWIYPE
jgi:superfamily I DNA/RNA helicase